MKNIKRKKSKTQPSQKVSVVKDIMKSGVKYNINAYLRIFNVGHGGGERTIGNLKIPHAAC